MLHLILAPWQMLSDPILRLRRENQRHKEDLAIDVCNSRARS